MKPLELIEQGRFLGEEFLLWLWMRGLTHGGTSGQDDDHSAWFVDDSIQLASEHGEVKLITLAKGNPAESAEAFEALGRGMRPVKAKARVLSGDMEWTFTLTAGTLGLSGIKLPPAQAKGQADLLAERAFLLEELLGHLERRLAEFTKVRVDAPEDLRQEFLNWIREGATAASLKESA